MKIRADEVISVLYGPCGEVGRVALDPSRETVVEKTTVLVSLPRTLRELYRGREEPCARKAPQHARQPATTGGDDGVDKGQNTDEEIRSPRSRAHAGEAYRGILAHLRRTRTRTRTPLGARAQGVAPTYRGRKCRCRPPALQGPLRVPGRRQGRKSAWMV